MGRLVSGIGNDRLNFGKGCGHLVIYIVKSHAVMDVTRRHHGFQNKAVLVAGRVSLIGKLALMLAVVKSSMAPLGRPPSAS